MHRRRDIEILHGVGAGLDRGRGGVGGAWRGLGVGRGRGLDAGAECLAACSCLVCEPSWFWASTGVTAGAPLSGGSGWRVRPSLRSSRQAWLRRRPRDWRQPAAWSSAGASAAAPAAVADGGDLSASGAATGGDLCGFGACRGLGGCRGRGRWSCRCRDGRSAQVLSPARPRPAPRRPWHPSRCPAVLRKPPACRCLWFPWFPPVLPWCLWCPSRRWCPWRPSRVPASRSAGRWPARVSSDRSVRASVRSERSLRGAGVGSGLGIGAVEQHRERGGRLPHGRFAACEDALPGRFGLVGRGNDRIGRDAGHGLTSSGLSIPSLFCNRRATRAQENNK